MDKLQLRHFLWRHAIEWQRHVKWYGGSHVEPLAISIAIAIHLDGDSFCLAVTNRCKRNWWTSRWVVASARLSPFLSHTFFARRCYITLFQSKQRDNKQQGPQDEDEFSSGCSVMRKMAVTGRQNFKSRCFCSFKFGGDVKTFSKIFCHEDVDKQ